MRNQTKMNLTVPMMLAAAGVAVASLAVGTGCGGKDKKVKPCQGAAAKKCLVQGVRLQSKGDEKSVRTALGLYELTCEGSGEWAMKGCTLAGHLYRMGKPGVSKDAKKALKRYEKACNLDRKGAYLAGPACFRAGNAYALGHYGLKRDPEKGKRYLQVACKDGDKDACKFVKMMESYTGKHSLAAVTKRCEQGNAKECGEAAYRYLKGHRGADKDGLKAVTYFTMGCDGKDAGSCGMLGLVYEKGARGVPKNATLSRRYYRKGCDMGHGASCVNLATDLLLSKDDRAKVKQGAQLLQTWCDKKERRACKWLGVAHRKGYGVRRSRALARKAFRRACRLGDKAGCRYARRL